MAAFQPKLSSNANENSEPWFLTAQLDTEDITLSVPWVCLLRPLLTATFEERGLARGAR